MGKFLALDLGGTNFRVLLIELDGQLFDMKSKIYAIPMNIMLGSGEQVCRYLLFCNYYLIHFLFIQLALRSYS